MDAIKIRLLMVGSFILFFLSMGTCRLNQFKRTEGNVIVQDTTLINQLTREKLELQVKYESKISLLQIQKDSLIKQVEEKKKALVVSRFKSKLMEEKLKEKIAIADSTGSLPDSLTEIVTVYIETQNEKDSICNETILNLEQVITCQDSSEAVHVQSEINLKGLLTIQELNNRSLEVHLNLQGKEIKKCNRQNKLLRAGIYVLTGISTSLIISQAIK